MRVTQHQRWGPGNCSGHKPKYTVRRPQVIRGLARFRLTA